MTRILRNHDDGSDGGSGSEPQAQGGDSGETAQYVTASDLQEFQNSMFANMRRMVDGIVSKTKPAATAQPKASNAQPAPTVDYAADRQRYDELNDELSEYDLTKPQRARIRRNFANESPESIADFIKAEASLFGVTSRAQAQSQEPTNSEPAMQKPRPSSDRGAPAQAAGLESNDPTWSLSPSEVDQVVRKHGMVGAGQILRSRLKADMRGKSFGLGVRRK